MKEKIKLLALGSGVALITALVSAFFGSFITRADYNKDQAVIEVIKNDLNHLKEGQEEIKEILKKSY